MKPNATSVIATANELIGTPYKTMDCQAFVEECVKRNGGQMAYAGSNDMYRNACTAEPQPIPDKNFKPPQCALLFIVAHDGGEPGKYKADGKGNANHVGYYAGLSGAITIHSSASKGKVVAGDMTGVNRGGWTHWAYAKCIDYGITADMPTEPLQPSQPETSQPIQPPKLTLATVYAANGKPVKMRAKPSKECRLYWELPSGTEISAEYVHDAAWIKIHHEGRDGYMMREFILWG